MQHSGIWGLREKPQVLFLSLPPELKNILILQRALRWLFAKTELNLRITVMAASIY